MTKTRSLLTRIGDAVGAAKEKASAAGADAKRALGKAKRTVRSKARTAEADAKQALGKAKRAVKRKTKVAAAGVKEAAAKVERAMSGRKPAAKRKVGAAKSALATGTAEVRKVARKAGAMVRKVTKGPAKKPATRTARKRKA